MPKPNAASARAVQEQMAQFGVEETDRWGVWSRGDQCGIVNEAGVFKVMGFRSRGDSTTVTVVGGPVLGQKSTREFRSFEACRLTTKIVKRGTKMPIEQEEEDGLG